MGTIAARDCLRVLQLTEQVAAAETLAVTQAIELRRRGSGPHGGAPAGELADEPTRFLASVLETFTFLEEDRPLEPELRRVVTMIQQRHWPLYT
jgi:histidine ammonia-lyase